VFTNFKRASVFLLMMLMLVGCWDWNELNTLAIVIGAAVDKEKPGVLEVTVQTVKTGGKPSGEQAGQTTNFINTSGKGSTVFAAARNTSVDISRRNYWPHAQVVVMGDKYAREGIISAVDFFNRDPQRRTTVYFILAEGPGKKLLSSKAKTEDLTAMELKEYIKQTERTGYGVTDTLREFNQQSESISGVSLLNKFRLKKEAPDEASQGASASTGQQPKEEAVLDGTGVFYNYKLAGYLTTLETRAVNWLRDKIKSTIISIDINKDGQDDLTLEVNKSKTNLKPIIKGGKYIMSAKVEIDGDIVEYSGKQELTELFLPKINKQIADKVAKEINNVFRVAKEELGLDIFGYADKYANQYPFLLDLNNSDWHKIFKDQVELELTVDVKVRFTGKSYKKSD